MYVITGASGKYGRLVVEALLANGIPADRIVAAVRKPASVLCADGSVVATQHRGIVLHDLGIGIATFEDVSDRKRAEDMLKQIAYEDPLTGLANRRAMEMRWSSLVTHGVHASPAMMAVMLIDLDDFKPINDVLGHAAGDLALLAVADRLRACVRADDLVSRLGGDEFVILVTDMPGPRQAEDLCNRIAKAFQQPFILDGREFVIGVSVGMSLYPQGASDLQNLLKQADEALYQIKRTGKGGWSWFAGLGPSEPPLSPMV